MRDVVPIEAGRCLTDRHGTDITGVTAVAAVVVPTGAARGIEASHSSRASIVSALQRALALRRYATTLLRAFSLDRPANALPALSPARSADLNESSVRTHVKIGTYLPVPLCGTGRGKKSRPAGRGQRACPSRVDNARRVALCST